VKSGRSEVYSNQGHRGVEIARLFRGFFFFFFYNKGALLSKRVEHCAEINRLEALDSDRKAVLKKNSGANVT
jgi:hypothetical protein